MATSPWTTSFSNGGTPSWRTELSTPAIVLLSQNLQELLEAKRSTPSTVSRTRLWSILLFLESAAFCAEELLSTSSQRAFQQARPRITVTWPPQSLGGEAPWATLETRPNLSSQGSASSRRVLSRC